MASVVSPRAASPFPLLGKSRSSGGDSWSRPASGKSRSSTGLLGRSSAGGSMATVLNEIENSRTYYWKGRVLSERGNQVEDQSFPTFLDMNQMFTAFGEELDIIHRMIKENCNHKLRKLTDEIYQSIRSELMAMQDEHRTQIAGARQVCRKELREAVGVLMRMQKDYNAFAIREVDRQFEMQLRCSEAKVERATRKLRQLLDEEERLRYAGTRARILMSKKRLLSDTETVVAEQSRLKTVAMVEDYQNMLAQCEEQILQLRGQIMELEEFMDEDVILESRPRTESTHLAPNRRRSALGSASTRLSSSRFSIIPGSMTVLEPLNEDSTALSEVGDEGEHEEPLGEEFNEQELAMIEELEQSYEDKISALEESNAQEQATLEAERIQIQNDWNARLTSLLKLHDEFHIKDITQKQTRLLQFALQLYKRRPPVNKEVTAYFHGLTLSMLAEEAKRMKEKEAEEAGRMKERNEEQETLEAEELHNQYEDMPFYIAGRNVSKPFEPDELERSVSSEAAPYMMGAFRHSTHKPHQRLKQGESERSVSSTRNSVSKTSTVGLGSIRRAPQSMVKSDTSPGIKATSAPPRKRASSPGKLIRGSTIKRSDASRPESRQDRNITQSPSLVSRSATPSPMLYIDSDDKSQPECSTETAASNLIFPEAIAALTIAKDAVENNTRTLDNRIDPWHRDLAVHEPNPISSENTNLKSKSAPIIHSKTSDDESPRIRPWSAASAVSGSALDPKPTRYTKARDR